MRAVVQRVTNASVVVGDETVGEIGPGLLVLLGAEEGDTDVDLKYTLDKVLNLRIFEDSDGKMNLSLLDTAGSLLVVSQFTLLGDCRKGRRPSFVRAMGPEPAERMVDQFIGEARSRGVKTESGRFRTDMDVHLTNDGPVTILIDSKKVF
ncbi:MAG: D-tyrosyl-tRNA(Tyr) deacylase [Myxococcales bacterium]|nr:D-tyrosyl-tRNA(Tyr) deacylase [Myxococcales bacterium]